MSRWKRKAEELIESIRQEPICVLVWGPGDAGDGGSEAQREAYQKRKDIRSELKRRFANAEVFFSEEEDMAELSREVVGQMKKEELQAATADIVILLPISRGVDYELDYMLKHDWFREKAWLLVPHEYLQAKSLFALEVRKIPPEQVQGFTQDEYHSCVVAKGLAVAAVTTAAMTKRLD